MRVLTISTDTENIRFRRYLASCDRFGIAPEVLGAGGDYPGHGTKSVLLHRRTGELDPDELVLYTDAWDVVFVRGLDGLEELFAAFDSPLVFSAQQYYHYIEPNKFRQYWRHPPGESPAPQFRFLNAGCLVGRAGYLHDFIEKLGLDQRTPSDQTVTTRWWLDHPECLKLDYRQRIFSGVSGREGLEGRDFRWIDGRLRHEPSGSFPYAIHFPGENGVCSANFVAAMPFPLPQPEPTDEDRRRYRGGLPRKRAIAALGITNYAWEIGRNVTWGAIWTALAAALLGYLL